MYDIIVVGAGHAGLEAAFIAAKFNLKVALFTLNEKGVANMPCNPSIGGPAKGVVTREIDALGGIQAIAADANKIQIKIVNSSKGPGVWAYRAQIDKDTYHSWFLDQIEKNENIDLIIDEIISLDIDEKEKKIIGLKTKNNNFYKSDKIIITTGTYLKSELYRDKKFAESGPDNFPRSNYLSDFLKKNNIEIIRLKTGTSPRVYIDSVNLDLTTKDDENNDHIYFSYQQPKTLPLNKQYYCYLTSTTEKTKDFIVNNKESFGIYNGEIDGTGPRYCPSIEDKFFRFPHREKHYIFIEPISKSSDAYYLSGISTSLNKDLQLEMLKTIKGFENIRIKTYAYAIVYDAINPIQLHKTLELKSITGLYFAGQVNGTSGYEEAAAQGLIAGINASLSKLNKKEFILKRHESYIGVMIDDITSKGVKDPYRLLTSRAEFRLFLRNDNADDRLMKYAYEMNLISEDIYTNYQNNLIKIQKNIFLLRNTYANKYKLVDKDAGPVTLFSWLCQPNNSYDTLFNLLSNKLEKLEPNYIEKMLIQIKYEGYIKQQEKQIKKIDKWAQTSLTSIKDYKYIMNLSNEAIDKLNQYKPITIYDALKISGLNINDIIWIKQYLNRGGKNIVDISKN